MVRRIDHPHQERHGLRPLVACADRFELGGLNPWRSVLPLPGGGGAYRKVSFGPTTPGAPSPISRHVWTATGEVLDGTLHIPRAACRFDHVDCRALPRPTTASRAVSQLTILDPPHACLSPSTVGVVHVDALHSHVERQIDHVDSRIRPRRTTAIEW